MSGIIFVVIEANALEEPLTPEEEQALEVQFNAALKKFETSDAQLKKARTEADSTAASNPYPELDCTPETP
jgi:hypothetical protein